ncbi:MAG: hypothetical protein MOGDAGHF_00733 [Rhodocyclaceae bacterium]|nr:hypothetical protein [Rhodocyclaceae bacterium]
MNEQRFRAILRELIDENPFAIRAVLKILELCFTAAVPTLAVTCEARPRLLVNPGFVARHCASDEEVKAVICHEFLHVLLRHTEARSRPTPARHLAADAVINAILHRQHGLAWSTFMARYYANCPDLRKLLRPMNADEACWLERAALQRKPLPQWAQAWQALYEGKLVADDIEELAEQLRRQLGSRSSRKSQPRQDGDPFVLASSGIGGLDDLIGGHGALGEAIVGPLAEALARALRQMNGSGIWRAPGSRGVGSLPFAALFAAQDTALAEWRRITLAILKRHLVPDRRARLREIPSEYRLPALSPGDRRAFLRATWTPFLPEARWVGARPERTGTAQVYLDVSGSMWTGMPHLVALLGRLSAHIRRPFWAFSDEVAPAVIEHGQLKAQTSGGTSMGCVLEHLARTRPKAAVVVTDGYIEQLDPALVARARGTRLHVLVSREGSPAELARCGIPYTQLPALGGRHA